MGLETTKLFLREGARVALVDVDKTAGATALTLVDHPSAIFVPCDVSSSLEVSKMIIEVEAAFGKVDILFNNAGIMHVEDSDAIDTSEDVWDLTMDVNAKGVFNCCKHGIPALKRSGGGSIINMSSFVARMGSATSQIACKLFYFH